MTLTVKAVLAIWLLLGSAAGAVAGESTFPDIQRILDQGKLSVAVRSRDAPPMIMTDNKGALTGSEADLARDIGKKMGVAVEFVRTADTYEKLRFAAASAVPNWCISHSHMSGRAAGSSTIAPPLPG